MDDLIPSVEWAESNETIVPCPVCGPVFGFGGRADQKMLKRKHRRWHQGLEARIKLASQGMYMEVDDEGDPNYGLKEA